MTARPAACPAPAPERAEVIAALRRGGGATVYAETLKAFLAAGHRTVLVASGRSYSGDELARMLAGVTRGLADEGLRERDVALLATRPGVEMLLVMVALLRIGAVGTPISVGAGTELFRRRMQVLAPTWVFGESLVYAASSPALQWALRARGLEIPRLAGIEARHVLIGASGWGSPRTALRWRRLVDTAGYGPEANRPGSSDSGTDRADLPHPDPSAAAVVVFTSGTTGEPKGVQHTGRSVAGTLSLILEHLDAADGALFSNQSVHSTLATVLARAPTVIAPLTFNARKWIAEADQRGVTHAFLRPSDAFRLVKRCEQRRRQLPNRLRRIYLYSAPVTSVLLRRLHALGDGSLRCLSVYGATEVLPLAWVDSRERLAWSGRGDLVGHPPEGVEVRVGGAGTLLVRGPNVHCGYLGLDPVEWHDTGDLARIDPDGRIVLLGRSKDMIIRDAFNIYPGLYEDTISRIPGVAACAMVGLPDAESGEERVVLFIEPDVRSAARKRRGLVNRVGRALRDGENRIDRSALPDEMVLIPRLPRNRSRKVDRLALKRLAVQRRGTQRVMTTPSTSAAPPAPKPWVVVPCYNEEKWIGDTLDALAAQTLRDFRLVLVDNGSTDATRAVIEERLRSSLLRDVIVLDEPEKGTGCAADTGFRYAIDQGAEVVYRTDADCLPRPTWLAELCRAMADGGLDAAGGKLVVRTDDIGLSWVKLIPSRIGIRAIGPLGRLLPSNRGKGYLTRYVLLPGSNVAIRAEAYLRCGGYLRRSFDRTHLDKEIANALRRSTPRIGYARRAVVLYSERRTEAYGVVGTIQWILNRGGHADVTDVR